MTKNTFTEGLVVALTCASLALGTAMAAGTSNDDVASSFKSDMEGFSNRVMVLRPELATYYGVSDDSVGAPVSRRLSQYDPASESRRRSSLEQLLVDLEAVDSSGYSARQNLSLELLTYSLEGLLLPARAVDYGMVVGDYGNWFLVYPLNHLSGPHVEFVTIMEGKFVIDSADDAQNFIARLQAFPAQVAGLLEKVDHDKKLGVIPPVFVLDNVLDGLQGQLGSDPAEHSLYLAFTDKLKQSDIEQSKKLAQAALTAMQEHYYPAVRQLAAAAKALRVDAKPEVGVTRLPNGEALYRSMIRHMTDTNLTPQEIHRLGLSEVERIHAEMNALLQTIGLEKGSVGERMQQLLNDPKYLYEDSEAGRAKLIADMRADLNLINKVLPQWFGLLPDQDVDIQAVPNSREATGCGACYEPPSEAAGRLGTFWINLSNIKSNPSYSLQTLTYHETNPGHHLQGIIGMSDDLPLLSTVFYSNAAGEGWGLYAEQLAAEMGVYEGDTVDDLGRLQAELHRAVRLVVDTGMHALNWSRERAIEYSIATEGIHPAEATFEIERYAIWPGQALGYKIGQLKIVELREKARSRLGDAFDIRQFHNQVLEDGTLPLGLLEAKIDAWIEAQLSLRVQGPA